MGRTKHKKHDWLPQYVGPERGWWVYRPYIGIKDGKKQYDKRQKIAKIGCTKGEFYIAFNRIVESKIDKSLRWLFDQYFESPKFKSLKPRTQKDYIAYARIICRQTLTNQRTGEKIKFGTLPYMDIKRPVMRGYLDNYHAPVAGNRHMQFMKAVYTWRMQYDTELTINPCMGVELNTEESRPRYIEDWEYAVLFECALTMRNPYFAPAMELSYLQCARRDEVFSLGLKDVKKEGVFLERGKGSDNEITAYTDRLNRALELASKIYPDAPVPIKQGKLLLHDKAGLKYKKNALDSAWQRVYKKAESKGAVIPIELAEEALNDGAEITEDGRIILFEHCTFHDIKAKAATDRENGETGHRTEKMRKVYQRKPKIQQATR